MQDSDSGKGASGDIIKSSSGHILECKYWNPESSDPRCLVFVSHGVGEHSLWYDELAKKLVGEGCKVFAHDHVGHGKSNGDRVHIDDFTIYCDDVVAHVKKVKEGHKDLPCFIIGHSMGGAIAIISALKNPELFKGVILISPAIMTDKKNVGPFKILISRIAGKIMPQLQVGSISPEWISRDAEVCKRYLEDPLVWHGGLKARWACCTLDALNFIQSNLENITFPFLILHGTEDKICHLQGSRIMQEKSLSIDKTLKVYEGAYHQVHNDLKETRAVALADITKWIVSRLTPSNSSL